MPDAPVALAHQAAKLRRRMLAQLDYIAAVARHHAFIREEAETCTDVTAAYVVEQATWLESVTATLLGTLQAARRLARVATRPEPLGECELIVTLADWLDLATNPNFPLSSVPWFVTQLRDVGREPIVITFVDGLAGPVATRAAS